MATPVSVYRYRGGGQIARPIRTTAYGSGLTLAFDDSHMLDAIQRHSGDVAREIADGFYHAKNKFFKTWWATAVRNGLRLQRRRGLMNYVIGLVKIDPRKIAEISFSLLNFSRFFWVHEKGALISGRGGKMAVPLTYSGDRPIGSPTTSFGRLPPRLYRKWLGGESFERKGPSGRTRKGTFRGEVDLFVRKGKAFLGQRTWSQMVRTRRSWNRTERAATGTQLMAVLKKTVRIKPRLGFFATWHGLAPWARDRLSMGFRRAIGKWARAA